MNQIELVLRDFLRTEDTETYLCRFVAISEGHSVKEADECVDGNVGCRNCPFRGGMTDSDFVSIQRKLFQMGCVNCQFDRPEAVKSCEECGTKPEGDRNRGKHFGSWKA